MHVQRGNRRGQRMKAVVYERYGAPDVLQLKDVVKPTPKANEILIKTYATTVTSADRRARSLDVPSGFGLFARLAFGVSKPRQPILGAEIAGVVEAIGQDVRKFHVGDRVFGISGIPSFGCYAEYKTLSETGAVASIPDAVTYAEAAALPFGVATALDFFRRGNLQRGERVLVNGASGAVGTAAVQLARYFGAEVTGVCSTANVELVKSLGANHVIDYTKEDFTRRGQIYDVIMDTVGTAPYSRSKRALTNRGRLLLVLGGLIDQLSAPWVGKTSSRQVIAGMATVRLEDLIFVAELIKAGEFKSVVDRCYPLEQIAEAHRYVDTGRKRGSVVVTVAHDDLGS